MIIFSLPGMEQLKRAERGAEGARSRDNLISIPLMNELSSSEARQTH
jgi:hypothetical protein